jgi:hypothetical protein
VALTLAAFSDFSKIFKFKFVHLGGDEVNTSKLAEIYTLKANICMLETIHAMLCF